MRILQLCNKSPIPPSEGGPIAMFHLAMALLKAGHSVDVLAVATPKYKPEQNILINYQFDNYTYRNVMIDTNIRISGAILAFLKHQPYIVTRFISKNFCETLVSMLREKKYDIVIFETLYMSSYLEIVRKNSNSLCILRSHNIEHQIWGRITVNMNNLPKRIYLKYLTGLLKKYEFQTLPDFDAIACISSAEKKYYDMYIPLCRTEVLPFGIDTDKLPEPKYNGHGFYHIGSMDWEPNIEGIRWFLKNVVPILEKNSPEIAISLAGRNMPAWLKEFKSPVVEIVGEVTDAAEFISSKSVLIVPLLSGSGIRIKIIEAMSLGKAVISTTIGAEGICAEHGKDIILADTPKDFAEAMIRMNCTHSHFEIGERARSLVEKHHSYKNFQESFCTLIDLLKK